MPHTVLAIGGHIGDMELTAGPLLAETILKGGRGIIVAATYGERGHPRLTPAEYREQKLAEARQFAEVIGSEFRALDYSDGFLPDDDAPAEQVAAIIRDVKPDIVVAHWKRSIHRDHSRAAELAERAVFLAAVPFDDGRARHGVTHFLHADNWEDADGFDPDCFVEISADAYGRWREAIEGHAFARGETYGFRYIDYYSARLTSTGCLAGVPRACAFARGGDRVLSRIDV
jgi:LmbE family N-acetylglucosaminyl deacetylase